MEKYGIRWPSDPDPLEIEFEIIRRGGQWEDEGQLIGNGLFYHFRQAQSLLWDTDDHHRWSNQALRAIIENDVTVFIGPKDSSKTYGMSRWALVDWWSSPDDGLFLVSSTDYRGSELRIWGIIKDLFNRAREKYPWLPGQILESMHCITNDEIDDEGRFARSLRKGFIFVPCMSNNRYVGLGKFVGIKPPLGPNSRLRHLGDEVQAMQASFLDAYNNWYGKPNFKGIMSGNPWDVNDPLAVAAEPMEGEGWNTFHDTGKTQTWRSRFFNAFVVNFDGRDSPNFDGATERYSYLIGSKGMNAVASTHGKDSPEMFQQCYGKFKPGMLDWRVITKQLCENHKAMDKAVWAGTQRTIVFALDPAYGGGDRCVGGHAEFGESDKGTQIIKIHPPEIIPINLNLPIEPEDQIAHWTKQRLEALNIGADHAFWESFGKGTLGYSFARVFGHSTPVPVDSGGAPTSRPVRADLFVEENNKLRPMRCNEYYSKFVTELWFSVRETIESEQMRELPKDVRQEGCMRTFRMVGGNKREVEPKEDMKLRTGRSPDLFDWLTIIIEGARRLGFIIQRVGDTSGLTESSDDDWFNAEQREQDEILKKALLVHD